MLDAIATDREMSSFAPRHHEGSEADASRQPAGTELAPSAAIGMRTAIGTRTSWGLAPP